ncbi:MAG TPA: hypothetical protein VKU38_24015 [Ktedonobacteraceae bacterium]|nr:hypothetical protein [Ktedonobacteraceae bacterium]
MPRRKQETTLNDSMADIEQPRRQLTDEKRASRRGLLRKGLGAAAAAVGAGALLDVGNAHAQTVSPNDNVGNFSSSNSSVPAVTATGTNGATGVQATSDSGTGLVAQSTSGDAIHATGPGGSKSAVYADGGNSNAVYAVSSGAGKSGVFGFNSSSTGYGIYGEGDTGTAVRGGTTSGIGVQATANGSSHNNAGVLNAAMLADGGVTYGLYATNNTSSAPTVLASNTASGGAGVALNVQGLVQVQGNAVGQATLQAGHTSVIVTSSAATTSSNILLTPLNKYKGVLWVTRSAGSFTINASTASTSAVNIAYLIIN